MVAVIEPFPPDGCAMGEALSPEGVLSGTFGRWARRLARRAAAGAAAGTGFRSAPTDTPAPPGALAGLEDLEIRLVRLADVDAGFGSFCEAVVTEDALERRLRTHDIDWVRARTRSLHLHAEDAAREALLCLRDDGLTLDDVGGRAQVEVSTE